MYIYLVLDDSVQAVFLGHVPKEMESACHNWAFHYQKKNQIIKHVKREIWFDCIIKAFGMDLALTQKLSGT